MMEMQLAMMKRYQMFAWLGLIIVLIAFLVALFVGANANATFFSVDKAAREAASAGSVLVDANVTRHSVVTWVPSFKFLGLGILLGAITMALGLIATTLRNLGKDVMATWPTELNSGIPAKPKAAKMFPMVMMMGWILLLVGLIWALVLNFGVVIPYWNHSIALELNPAEPGSLLLTQLSLIVGTMPWLGFLRFLGMAFLFTGITIALTVIIRTLQFQEKTLQNYVEVRAGGTG